MITDNLISLGNISTKYDEYIFLASVIGQISSTSPLLPIQTVQSEKQPS